MRILFLGDSASAVRSVSRLESSFAGLGRTAKLLTGALAVGIVGGLAASVKAAVDFDRAMRNVNSIARLSESQFKSLEKQVLSLSKTTGQAPKTLAEGLYDIVSSGFKAADGLKILRASATAATAGLTDTATSTKAIVAVLNAYHLSADQATKVSDVLFQTVNKGVLTFDELSQQIGDVLPAASTLGVPLTEVGGALATITLHGVNAAEAATQVKQILVSMLKPSEGLSKEFKSLGFESGQAALKQLGLVGVIEKLSHSAGNNKALIASWFPNVRALGGFFGLAGKNIQQFTQNVDAMGQRGATARAFAEQGKSISVQWQKAKAALIAAAIPIGQLLFPLLAKAAGKVSEFASSIENNMPQIQQRFGQLASVIGSVARELVHLGTSTGGLAVLIGGGTAFGIGQTALGIQNMVGALKTMPPVLAGATLGLGFLAGAAFYSWQKLKDNTDEAGNLQRALDGLSGAHLQARQAALNFQGALIQQKVAQAELVVATRARNQIDRQANPQLYAAAQLRVAQALHAVKQSALDVTRAQDDNKKAQNQSARAASKTGQAYRDLAGESGVLFRNISDIDRAGQGTVQRYYDLQRSGLSAKQAIAQLNREFANRTSSALSRSLLPLIQNLASGKTQANLFQKAVAALAYSLGRLPTHKEVNIFLRTFGGDNVVNGRHIGRAAGGFIPGPVGAPVPILAHAGEIVLNPKQQQALGGPRFLSQLFGFTGDEGPGFAAGGIVTKRPNRKHSGKTRHSHRPPRTKTTGKAAKRALSAVDAVNQKEDDLDRAYGQLARQYDISPEQYIVTNDQGVDVVNQSGMTVGGKFIRGIDQRVAEIDSLLGSRQSMLDLIDQEKAQLKKAIKKLQAAVKALLAAIRAEHAAIRDLNHQISGERRKKKPNQAKIGRWQNAISGHNTTIGNMTSTLSEFRGAIKDSNQNLLHVLPFDRRDVELDMASLSFERGDISGTTLPPGQGGGGVAQIPPNLAGLAQAIGSLQGSILGQFQMGSLHVPETGLYRLHAGETVTPAGVKRGGDGGSISDVKVRVELAGDLQGLENFIRVTAVKATPEIGAELGRRGDERLRGGRY